MGGYTDFLLSKEQQEKLGKLRKSSNISEQRREKPIPNIEKPEQNFYYHLNTDQGGGDVDTISSSEHLIHQELF